MVMEKLKTFRAFWPTYLRAHRDPRCRRMHYVGSTGTLLGAALAVALLDPLWLVAGFAFGYGMAWIGHFAFEHNRPATFSHPAWSLAGDIRMYALWLSGRLGPALKAAEAGDAD